MPGRSGGGTGAGLRLPSSRSPVFSMSQTSSTICPDGTSNRIDSPCPTDAPLDIRVIWQPEAAGTVLELVQVVLGPPGR